MTANAFRPETETARAKPAEPREEPAKEIQSGKPAPKKPATKAAETADVPHLVDKVRADAMRANMSAIMTADVEDLQTAGTVVGIAQVGNDVEITTSVAGIVAAKGDVSIHQAVAGWVVGSNDVTVNQGGSTAVIANKYSIESGVNAVVVATEADVSHGWVGFLLAPKARISEDSRVFIDTTAALIIGGLIAGAILVAAVLLSVFGVRAARTAASWRPKMPGLTWE